MYDNVPLRDIPRMRADSRLPTSSVVQQAALSNNLLVANTAYVDQAVLLGRSAWSINEFRLSATSINSVADVSNAATLTLVPVMNDGWVDDAFGKIALSDANNNVGVYVGQGPSLSMSTLGFGTVNDIFAYGNPAGYIQLTSLAWTNTTTRATGLDWNNGILTLSGSPNYRYVGTVYCNGSSATVTDSPVCRGIWNVQNRVMKPVYVTESTVSWTYSTNTWRYANNNSANSVKVVQGMANADPALLETLAFAANSSGALWVASGIGLNSSSSNSARIYGTPLPASGIYSRAHSIYDGYLTMGLNTIYWLEWSAATGTTTWLSNTNITTLQLMSGLSGMVTA